MQTGSISLQKDCVGCLQLDVGIEQCRPAAAQLGLLLHNLAPAQPPTCIARCAAVHWAFAAVHNP